MMAIKTTNLSLCSTKILNSESLTPLNQSPIIHFETEESIYVRTTEQVRATGYTYKNLRVE